MPCARLERCLLIRPAFNRRDFNIPAHGFRLTFKKGLTVGQLVERPGTVVFPVLTLKDRSLGQLILPLGRPLQGLHVGPVGLFRPFSSLKCRLVYTSVLRLDFLLPVRLFPRLEGFFPGVLIRRLFSIKVFFVPFLLKSRSSRSIRQSVFTCQGDGFNQLIFALGLPLQGLHVGPVGLLMLLAVLQRRPIGSIRLRLDLLRVGFQAGLEELHRRPFPFGGIVTRTGLRFRYSLVSGRGPRPDLLFSCFLSCGYVPAQLILNRRGLFGGGRFSRLE